MDTINGFPIIATWATAPRGIELRGRIIVVGRGTEHDERYVVAWQGWKDPGWDTHWIESAYCLDKPEAARVFAARIEREVLR